MKSGAGTLMSMGFYIISFIAWFAVECAGQNGCMVDRSAVAVTVGNYVSLTCIASSFVAAWRRGNHYNNASVVYGAPIYGAAGTVVEPRIVKDGYFVDDSNVRQVILIMNTTSTEQADRYYCVCSIQDRSYIYDTSNVTVLVSKPTFLTSTSDIIDGESLNITCSISFNGTAGASLGITDAFGVQVEQRSVGGTYPSNPTDLRVINLVYLMSANSKLNQTYSCQISLTDSSMVIYSEQLATSVNVSIPVREVQIKPNYPDRCINGDQCALNQTINCKAEGNPVPVVFQWIGVLNGISFNMNTSGQLFLSGTGNYTVLCTAFNVVRGITYNNTSDFFKTEVTFYGPSTTSPVIVPRNDSNKLGLGLGIGLGVGIPILILIVVGIFLVWKRKKSGTVCCNPDDKETRNTQSVELSKKENGNNSFSKDNGLKKNVHSAGEPNKGFERNGNDEVTLVENDLYNNSGKQTKKQIDPSDGGYASVNEVIPHGR